MDIGVPRVFETNNVGLAVRLLELGWRLFEVLAAPPAAGGSTFVLRWTGEWPPGGGQHLCPDEPGSGKPADPGGVRVGIAEIEAFLAEAAEREQAPASFRSR